MDTDREPAAAVLQSEPEVISPVNALGEGTGTVQPDRSNPAHRNVVRTTPRIDAPNLGPSAGASSEDFYDTSSLQPLAPLQQPSDRPLELNSGRRETRIKTSSEIDWIPKEEEKVSNVLILNL